MALQFCDGFDKYSASADFHRNGWVVPSTSAFQFDSTGGRFGGGSLNLQVLNGTLWRMSRLLPTPVATVVVGFHIKVNNYSAPQSGEGLVRLTNRTGIANCILRINTDGSLGLYRQTTAVATSAAGIISLSTYYHIELKVTISDTGAYELKVDGITVLSGTGDFFASGNAEVYQVELSSQVETVPFDFGRLDDFVVLDTTGGVLDDFLGPMRIQTLTPTAEGDASDFTPSSGADNALMVDDAVADDDSTYVESSTVNHEDLHAHGDTADTITGIAAVVVNARAKDSGGFGRGLKLSAKSSATTARSSEVSLMGYKLYQHAFTVDPNTASAWSQAAVDAAQFGYQISS